MYDVRMKQSKYLEIVSKFRFQYNANLSELINLYFLWNHQKTYGSLII